jgi:hypothetical protein
MLVCICILRVLPLLLTGHGNRFAQVWSLMTKQIVGTMLYDVNKSLHADLKGIKKKESNREEFEHTP